MAAFQVECLRCGNRRELVRAAWRHLEEAECQRCDYVGWAPADELDERARRLLRTRSVEQRRLRLTG